MLLTSSCWSAPPLEDKIIAAALETERLSLLEVGTFGEMRTFGFSDLLFKTRKLPGRSYVMGVSSAGDRLLINVESHRNSYQPQMPDEVDITDLDRTIFTKIQPSIRGMLSFHAELSPNGQSIAFAGDFAPFNARGVYGLHLLGVSGEIRTLVATTEARTPSSVGWSRDGRTIVYDLEDRVLLYHLDTGSSSPLADGSRPAWSPDGLWIAYRRPDGTAALIRPDGTDSKHILDNVQLGWGLQWTPDSRYLLYTDATAGGIRVVDTKTRRTATIFRPLDGNYTESRLRWVRGMVQ